MPNWSKGRARPAGASTCSALAAAVLVVIIFTISNISSSFLQSSPSASSALRAYLNIPTPVQLQTIILPSVVDPDQRQERLSSIADTWGSEIPTKIITAPPSLNFDAFDLLIHTYKNLLDSPSPEFTHYLFANDHTFVIPRNLHHFLTALPELFPDPDVPVYLGHRLKHQEKHNILVFNSGAAGYILNRASLSALLDGFDSHRCKNPTQKFTRSNPGLAVAACLKSLGIHAHDFPEPGGVEQRLFNVSSRHRLEIIRRCVKRGLAQWLATRASHTDARILARVGRGLAQWLATRACLAH
jgi:hypothetical protein